MSGGALDWALHRAPIPLKTEKGEPSPAVLAHVLLLLAYSHTEEVGLAFRSVKRMASRARLDERTVRSALRSLEAYGLIQAARDPDSVQAVRNLTKAPGTPPTGYRLALHLDNDSEHLDPVDRAGELRKRGRGASGPPRASDPGGGGRATRGEGGEPPPNKKMTQKLIDQGSPQSGTSPARVVDDHHHRTCTLHRNDPHPPPCGACQAARRAYEGVRDAEARASVEADRIAAENRREARARALAECELCDERGYHLEHGRWCSHSPARESLEVAAKGRAKVDAVLAEARQRRRAAPPDMDDSAAVGQQ